MGTYGQHGQGSQKDREKNQVLDLMPLRIMFEMP